MSAPVCVAAGRRTPRCLWPDVVLNVFRAGPVAPTPKKTDKKSKNSRPTAKKSDNVSKKKKNSGKEAKGSGRRSPKATPPQSPSPPPPPPLPPPLPPCTCVNLEELHLHGMTIADAKAADAALPSCGRYRRRRRKPPLGGGLSFGDSPGAITQRKRHIVGQEWLRVQSKFFVAPRKEHHEVPTRSVLRSLRRRGVCRPTRERKNYAEEPETPAEARLRWRGREAPGARRCACPFAPCLCRRTLDAPRGRVPSAPKAWLSLRPRRALRLVRRLKRGAAIEERVQREVQQLGRLEGRGVDFCIDECVPFFKCPKHDCDRSVCECKFDYVQMMRQLRDKAEGRPTQPVPGQASPGQPPLELQPEEVAMAERDCFNRFFNHRCPAGVQAAPAAAGERAGDEVRWGAQPLPLRMREAHGGCVQVAPFTKSSDTVIQKLKIRLEQRYAHVRLGILRWIFDFKDLHLTRSIQCEDKDIDHEYESKNDEKNKFDVPCLNNDNKTQEAVFDKKSIPGVTSDFRYNTPLADGDEGAQFSINQDSTSNVNKANSEPNDLQSNMKETKQKFNEKTKITNRSPETEHNQAISPTNLSKTENKKENVKLRNAKNIKCECKLIISKEDIKDVEKITDPKLKRNSSTKKVKVECECNLLNKKNQPGLKKNQPRKSINKISEITIKQKTEQTNRSNSPIDVSGIGGKTEKSESINGKSTDNIVAEKQGRTENIESKLINNKEDLKIMQKSIEPTFKNKSSKTEIRVECECNLINKRQKTGLGIFKRRKKSAKEQKKLLSSSSNKIKLHDMPKQTTTIQSLLSQTIIPEITGCQNKTADVLKIPENKQSHDKVTLIEDEQNKDVLLPTQSNPSRGKTHSNSTVSPCPLQKSITSTHLSPPSIITEKTISIDMTSAHLASERSILPSHPDTENNLGNDNLTTACPLTNDARCQETVVTLDQKSESCLVSKTSICKNSFTVKQIDQNPKLLPFCNEKLSYFKSLSYGSINRNKISFFNIDRNISKRQNKIKTTQSVSSDTHIKVKQHKYCFCCDDTTTKEQPNTYSTHLMHSKNTENNCLYTSENHITELPVTKTHPAHTCCTESYDSIEDLSIDSNQCKPLDIKLFKNKLPTQCNTPECCSKPKYFFYSQTIESINQ